MTSDDVFFYQEDKTAGAYLTEAHRAPLGCGDPQRLYHDLPVEETGPADLVANHLIAQRRQLDFARTSILFAALASEAYINGFLGTMLDEKDFDALEKLGTADKYVLGPELALGRRLFERDREPTGTIVKLFKLRNKLVHPKIGRVKFTKGSLLDPRFKDFNPAAAAQFVVRVGEVSITLAAHENPPRETDEIAESLVEKRRDVLAFGRQLRDRLPAPPTPPVPPPLPPAPPPMYGVPSAIPRAASSLYNSVTNVRGTATGPAPADYVFLTRMNPQPLRRRRDQS